MSCSEFVELVTDYLEGRMAGAEAEAFEAHMGLCPPCLHYLDQMRATLEALGRIPEESLPDGARESSCTRSPSATPTETARQRESGAALASRAASTPTAERWGYFSFSLLKTPAWSES